jgi:hypothetical protein
VAAGLLTKENPMSDKTPKLPTLPAAFDAYYATDTDRETEGDWIDFAAAGLVLLLARPGGSNKRWDKVLDEKTKPYQHMTIEGELDARLMRETYAEAVVLDWRRLDGAPLDPYTAEACVALFEAYPDFYRDVRAVASKRSLWRKKGLEADAGN